MKSKLLYIFLILFGFILAILSVELTFRTIQFLGAKNLFNLKPIYTTLKWENHKSLGKFMLKPNQNGWFVTPSGEYQTLISTNNEGFHDSNHSIKKPKNIYRIILLGDSFVANLQSPLEQTIGKQIEKKLNNKNLEKKVEIIPIGLGDTGSMQQLLALKEIGLKYKPDLIVQLFFTANDIKNNSLNLQGDPYRDYYILEKDKLIVLPKKEGDYTLITQIKNQLKKLKSIEKILYIRQIYNESKKVNNNNLPTDYQIYQSNLNQDYKKNWDITQRLILETKKESDKINAKYLLITLANNEQVNEEVLLKLQKKYPYLKSSEIDLENPDKLVMNFCKKNSIDCMRLLPIFKHYSKENNNSPTHHKYDGHWNSIGIKIASSAISDYLFEYNYFSTK